MNLLVRLCLVCAWALTATTSAGDRPPALTVYAAASLKETLDILAADWKASTGQEVHVSYAATSILARQIEQGAPADVFISADAEWMDHLQQLKLIDVGSRYDLLQNQLVLVAPSTSSLQAFNLQDADAWSRALQGDRLAIAETQSVPAGRYARQALERLGVWSGLASRLAQSDNVRVALSFVALGEAPLGIVYVTDARAEPKVRVVMEISAELHAPIVYPVARVRSGDARPSRDFLLFLNSSSARTVFARAGFTALPKTP